MPRMARFMALWAAMAILGGCSLTPSWTVTLWSENGHGQQDAPRLKELLGKQGATTLASVEENRVVAKIRGRKLDPSQLAALVKPHTLGFHFLVDDQGPLRPAQAGIEGLPGLQAGDIGGVGLTWLGNTCQALEPLGAKATIPANQQPSCVCEDWRPPPRCRLVLLERDPVVTGRTLSQAQGVLSEQDDPEVDLVFDDEGRRLLAEATRSGAGRFMAVVLDGKALIVPRVNEPIGGGRLRVALGTQVGDRDAQIKEAYELSIALQATMLKGRWTVQDMTR
jgi:hypothetical protein